MMFGSMKNNQYSVTLSLALTFLAPRIQPSSVRTPSTQELGALDKEFKGDRHEAREHPTGTHYGI